MLAVLLWLKSSLKLSIGHHISACCVSLGLQVLETIVFGSTVIALDSQHRDLLSLLSEAVLDALNLTNSLTLPAQQSCKCFGLSIFIKDLEVVLLDVLAAHVQLFAPIIITADV